MPTPSVYSELPDGHFDDVPLHMRNPAVDIMFFTDRAPEANKSGADRYGYGRSESLAFGSVIVNLGDDLTWEELVAASVAKDQQRPLNLSLGAIDEVGRFPPNPSGP